MASSSSATASNIPEEVLGAAVELDAQVGYPMRAALRRSYGATSEAEIARNIQGLSTLPLIPLPAPVFRGDLKSRDMLAVAKLLQPAPEQRQAQPEEATRRTTRGRKAAAQTPAPPARDRIDYLDIKESLASFKLPDAEWANRSTASIYVQIYNEVIACVGARNPTNGSLLQLFFREVLARRSNDIAGFEGRTPLLEDPDERLRAKFTVGKQSGAASGLVPYHLLLRCRYEAHCEAYFSGRPDKIDTLPPVDGSMRVDPWSNEFLLADRRQFAAVRREEEGALDEFVKKLRMNPILDKFFFSDLSRFADDVARMGGWGGKEHVGRRQRLRAAIAARMDDKRDKLAEIDRGLVWTRMPDSDAASAGAAVVLTPNWKGAPPTKKGAPAGPAVREGFDMVASAADLCSKTLTDAIAQCLLAKKQWSMDTKRVTVTTAMEAGERTIEQTRRAPAGLNTQVDSGEHLLSLCWRVRLLEEAMRLRMLVLHASVESALADEGLSAAAAAAEYEAFASEIKRTALYYYVRGAATTVKTTTLDDITRSAFICGEHLAENIMSVLDQIEGTAAIAARFAEAEGFVDTDGFSPDYSRRLAALRALGARYYDASVGLLRGNADRVVAYTALLGEPLKRAGINAGLAGQIQLLREFFGDGGRIVADDYTKVIGGAWVAGIRRSAELFYSVCDYLQSSEFLQRDRNGERDTMVAGETGLAVADVEAVGRNEFRTDRTEAQRISKAFGDYFKKLLEFVSETVRGSFQPHLGNIMEGMDFSQAPELLPQTPLSRYPGFIEFKPFDATGTPQDPKPHQERLVKHILLKSLAVLDESEERTGVRADHGMGKGKTFSYLYLYQRVMEVSAYFDRRTREWGDLYGGKATFLCVCPTTLVAQLAEEMCKMFRFGTWSIVPSFRERGISADMDSKLSVLLAALGRQANLSYLMCDRDNVPLVSGAGQPLLPKTVGAWSFRTSKGNVNPGANLLPFAKSNTMGIVADITVPTVMIISGTLRGAEFTHILENCFTITAGRRTLRSEVRFVLCSMDQLRALHEHFQKMLREASKSIKETVVQAPVVATAMDVQQMAERMATESSATIQETFAAVTGRATRASVSPDIAADIRRRAAELVDWTDENFAAGRGADRMRDILASFLFHPTKGWMFTAFCLDEAHKALRARQKIYDAVLAVRAALCVPGTGTSFRMRVIELMDYHRFLGDRRPLIDVDRFDAGESLPSVTAPAAPNLRAEDVPFPNDDVLLSVFLWLRFRGNMEDIDVEPNWTPVLPVGNAGIVGYFRRQFGQAADRAAKLQLLYRVFFDADAYQETYSSEDAVDPQLRDVIELDHGVRRMIVHYMQARLLKLINDRAKFNKTPPANRLSFALQTDLLHADLSTDMALYGPVFVGPTHAQWWKWLELYFKLYTFADGAGVAARITTLVNTVMDRYDVETNNRKAGKERTFTQQQRRAVAESVERSMRVLLPPVRDAWALYQRVFCDQAGLQDEVAQGELPRLTYAPIRVYAMSDVAPLPSALPRDLASVRDASVVAPPRTWAYEAQKMARFDDIALGRVMFAFNVVYGYVTETVDTFFAAFKASAAADDDMYDKTSSQILTRVVGVMLDVLRSENIVDNRFASVDAILPWDRFQLPRYEWVETGARRRSGHDDAFFYGGDEPEPASEPVARRRRPRGEAASEESRSEGVPEAEESTSKQTRVAPQEGTSEEGAAEESKFEGDEELGGPDDATMDVPAEIPKEAPGAAARATSAAAREINMEGIYKRALLAIRYAAVSFVSIEDKSVQMPQLDQLLVHAFIWFAEIIKHHLLQIYCRYGRFRLQFVESTHWIDFFEVSSNGSKLSTVPKVNGRTITVRLPPARFDPSDMSCGVWGKMFADYLTEATPVFDNGINFYSSMDTTFDNLPDPVRALLTDYCSRWSVMIVLFYRLFFVGKLHDVDPQFASKFYAPVFADKADDAKEQQFTVVPDTKTIVGLLQGNRRSVFEAYDFNMRNAPGRGATTQQPSRKRGLRKGGKKTAEKESIAAAAAEPEQQEESETAMAMTAQPLEYGQADPMMPRRVIATDGAAMVNYRKFYNDLPRRLRTMMSIVAWTICPRHYFLLELARRAAERGRSLREIGRDDVQEVGWVLYNDYLRHRERDQIEGLVRKHAFFFTAERSDPFFSLTFDADDQGLLKIPQLEVTESIAESTTTHGPWGGVDEIIAMLPHLHDVDDDDTVLRRFRDEVGPAAGRFRRWRTQLADPNGADMFRLREYRMRCNGKFILFDAKNLEFIRTMCIVMEIVERYARVAALAACAEITDEGARQTLRETYFIELDRATADRTWNPETHNLVRACSLVGASNIATRSISPDAAAVVPSFMDTRSMKQSSNLLLMTMLIGSVGLNLYVADTAGTLDEDFSMAVNEQAFARIYRLSQRSSTVCIYQPLQTFWRAEQENQGVLSFDMWVNKRNAATKAYSRRVMDARQYYSEESTQRRADEFKRFETASNTLLGANANLTQAVNALVESNAIADEDQSDMLLSGADGGAGAQARIDQGTTGAGEITNEEDTLTFIELTSSIEFSRLVLGRDLSDKAVQRLFRRAKVTGFEARRRLIDATILRQYRKVVDDLSGALSAPVNVVLEAVRTGLTGGGVPDAIRAIADDLQTYISPLGSSRDKIRDALSKDPAKAGDILSKYVEYVLFSAAMLNDKLNRSLDENAQDTGTSVDPQRRTNVGTALVAAYAKVFPAPPLGFRSGPPDGPGADKPNEAYRMLE